MFFHVAVRKMINAYFRKITKQNIHIRSMGQVRVLENVMHICNVCNECYAKMPAPNQVLCCLLIIQHYFGQINQ